MSSNQTSTAVMNHLPPIGDRLGYTYSVNDSLQHEDFLELDHSKKTAMQKPAPNHIQTIEAKRAMLIMDNCITKVLLVSEFPQIVANIQYYELLLGRETKLLFQEYGRVSREFEEAINATTKGSTISCVKFQELKDGLFSLTRRITRHIMSEPTVIEALIRHYREWRVEPPEMMREMVRYLVQLRFILRQVLLVSPRETAERDEYIDRVEKQGDKRGLMLQRLIDRSESLKLEYKEMSDKKTLEIERLNACLLATEEEAAQTIATMREKFAKELKEDRKKHKKTMKMLADDVAAAHESYKEESSSFQRREQAIRRQKWRIEDQLDGILKKMDDQLFELQKKYDEEKRLYDEELKAYEFLNLKFKPLKVEYDAIMEEKAKKEEAQLQVIKERNEMVRSATFITSLYRAYAARRRIRAERKSQKFSKFHLAT